MSVGVFDWAIRKEARETFFDQYSDDRQSEEETEMKEIFLKFAREGGDLLDSHITARDPRYLNWEFYGTCQACEAAEDLGEAGF